MNCKFTARAFFILATTLILISAAAFASTVSVSSPAPGVTTTSPVHFIASASSSYPISAMRIYVDNVSAYTVDAASLNTSLTMTPGSHYVVVQAWDSKGTVMKSTENITVASSAASSNVQVSMTPTTVAIQQAAAQQFAATVSGTSNTAVTWKVNGVQGGNSTVGTVSTAGLYKAPGAVASSTTVSVSATSSANTAKSATANVTVLPKSNSSVAVSVTPTSTSIAGGQTKQFAATVTGTTNTGVTWQVNGVTGGGSSTGTISTSGLYSAPVVTSSTNVTITALSTYDTAEYANATATIAASTTTGNQGPTIYVATNGSNSSSCGTSTSPCATPDYAANNRASAGTTVSVAAGTYSYGSGTATFSKSGTSGNPIVVQCATQWACFITSTIATGDNTQVVQINSNYLTFTGFDVTDTGGSTTNANNGVVIGGTYDTVSHNRIHDIHPVCDSNGGGGISVYVTGSTVNAVVDSNLVYNIGFGYSPCTSTSQYQTHGINMESNGSATITNNLIYNTTGWAIQYQGTINGGVIANNTILGAYQGGLVIEPEVTNLYAVNNIILNTGSKGSSYGVDLTMNSSNSSIVADNNLLYGNVNGNLSGSGAASANTITTVNPASGTLFVNYQANGSGNYQLAAGSPAIKAGDSTNAPATDFTGTAQTAPPSIGAYTHQ